MSYSSASDVVAVFDSSFNQVFADARIIKAQVKPTAKLAKHPREDGTSIVDNRVIEPLKIDLHVILTPATFKDTYAQVYQIFLGDATVQVQTKTGLYANMLIATMPSEEDPAHFDTVTMTINLEEALFVTSSTSPLPATAVTAKNGNVNGSAATATETSQSSQKVQASSAAYSAGKKFGFFN